MQLPGVHEYLPLLAGIGPAWLFGSTLLPHSCPTRTRLCCGPQLLRLCVLLGTASEQSVPPNLNLVDSR